MKRLELRAVTRHQIAVAEAADFAVDFDLGSDFDFGFAAVVDFVVVLDYRRRHIVRHIVRKLNP